MLDRWRAQARRTNLGCMEGTSHRRRLVGLLALLAAACAQAARATPWNREVKRADLPVFARSIAPAPGGVWLGGNTMHSGFAKMGALVRLDGDGRVAGAWHLTSDAAPSVTDLSVATAAGSDDILLSGFQGAGAFGDALVARRRPDGSWAWRSAFVGVSGYPGLLVADGSGGAWVSRGRFWCAHVLSDGSLGTVQNWSVGQVNAIWPVPGGLISCGFVGSNGFVARMNDDGSIAWNLDVPGASSFSAVTQQADGTLVIVGSRSGTPSGVVLLRLRPDGSTVDAGAWITDLSARTITVLGSGDLAVTGHVAATTYIGVMLLSANLGARSGQMMGSFGTSGIRSATTLDGDLVMAAELRDTSGNPQRDLALVMRFGPLLEADLPCSDVQDLPITPQAFAPTPLPGTWSPAATVATLAPAAIDLTPMTVRVRPAWAAGWEQDDGCGTQTPLRDGEIQGHDGCDDSSDAFRVAAVAGTTYQVTTTAIGALADTRLEILDAACANVLAAAAGAPGGETLSYAPTTDGDLIVRVTFEDGGQGGQRSYEISMTGRGSPSATWATYLEDVNSLAHSVVASEAGVTVAIPRGSLHVRSDGVPGPVLSLPFVDALSATPDCGMVATGVAGSVEFVQRLDGAGAELWSLGLDAQATWLRGCDAGADGAAWVAGYSDRKLLVARVAAEGTLAWTRLFGADLLSEGVRIAGARDGGAYAVGAGRAGTGLGFLIVRVGPDGEPYWARAIALPEFLRAVAAVQPLDDGGVLVVGTTVLPLSWDEVGASYAVRCDATGSVVWARRLAGGRYTHLFNSTVDERRRLLLVGRGDAVPGPSGDGVLLALESDGSIAWQRGFDLGGGFDSIDSIALAPDGSVYLGGHTLSVRGKAVIVRLDPALRPPDDRIVASSMGITSEPIAALASSWDPVIERDTVPEIDVVVAGSIVPQRTEEPFLGRGLPAEVSVGCDQLLMFRSRTTFEWGAAAASAAQTFNVHRGWVSSLRAGAYGACLASGLTSPIFDDPALPGLVDPFFYLVGGRTPSGDGPLTRQHPQRTIFPSPSCP